MSQTEYPRKQSLWLRVCMLLIYWREKWGRRGEKWGRRASQYKDALSSWLPQECSGSCITRISRSSIGGQKEEPLSTCTHLPLDSDSVHGALILHFGFAHAWIPGGTLVISQKQGMVSWGHMTTWGPGNGCWAEKRQGSGAEVVSDRSRGKVWITRLSVRLFYWHVTNVRNFYSNPLKTIVSLWRRITNSSCMKFPLCFKNSKSIITTKSRKVICLNLTKFY